MGLDGGNTIECQLIVLQNNELCYTNWEYAPTGVNVNLDIFACTAVIVAAISDPLQAALSASAYLVSLNTRLRGTVNSGLTYSYPLNLYGDVAGDVMPPYITFSFRKFPDNDTAYSPEPSPDFEVGRWQVSGVPEGAQNNGILNPSTASAMSDLAAALRVIPADTVIWNTPELGMCMTRYDATGFVRRAWVEYLTFARIGTQLTRKR